MKRFILGLVFLLSWGAWATDMVTRQGKDVLRLSDSPCVNAGILAQLQPQWRDKFRKGGATISGKSFEACWIADEHGVFVTFDDGDEQRLPLAIFRPEPGV